MHGPARLPLAQHIRTRPGMYIGGLTPRGLLSMVDDIVDEQLAAHAAAPSPITITLLPDNRVRIEFPGGILDVRPEDFITEFDAADPNPTPLPKFLSLTIAAAMSDPLHAEFVRDGKAWSQSFSAGVPLNSPKHAQSAAPSGFRVVFRPDPALFKCPPLQFLRLCGRIQERAIFHPATLFRIEDDTVQPQIRRDFRYPNGLRSYLDEIEHEWLGHALLRINERQRLWHLQITEGSDQAEAVIFDRDIGPYVIHSYVNGRRTPEGGTHVEGFEQAFTEVAPRHVLEPDRYHDPEEPALTAMTVLLSVRITEPRYHSGTRDRLDDERAKRLVERMVKIQLPDKIAESQTIHDVS